MNRLPGRQVPFITRNEPQGEIPQILASEVGMVKNPAVFAANLAKVVIPGQVLGRLSATNEYIPAKLATVATAIADTTASTSIVVDDASPFAVGDVIAVTLDAGAVNKTITAVNKDTNTITFTALGAGALSVGARVSTTAALGGTAVAIAAQYLAGGTNTEHYLDDAIAQQQMSEVFRAGRFRKRKLIGWNAQALSDLSAKEQADAVPAEHLDQGTDDVVVIG